MQSAIKTCLAIAMLGASVEALELERKGGRRGGRGRGGFSCDRLDKDVERMEDYTYAGDGV